MDGAGHSSADLILPVSPEANPTATFGKHRAPKQSRTSSPCRQGWFLALCGPSTSSCSQDHLQLGEQNLDLYPASAVDFDERFPLPACLWLLLCCFFGLVDISGMSGLQNLCLIKFTGESSICLTERRNSACSVKG